MALLGPDGNPIITRPRPDTREIVIATIRDKWSTYPTQGLTPERLARIFREADYGDIYRQAELFEEMEEKDTHLFSILQTRKNAVLGLDWEVMPYSSDDPRDREIADFVAGVFDNIKGLEDSFLDLLDAIGKGFAASEIMWSIRNGRAVIDELRWRHQKRFRFGEQDELRLIGPENFYPGDPLPERKFAVHKYKARSGHPSRAGVLRVVAWMYLFKNYDLKDWVAFAEIYGMPLRLGRYDANTSKEDKDALIQAVSQLGTDAAGVISKSTEIEFVQAIKSSSSDIYKLLADFCNAEMSKAVLGQTLTTEVGSTGSYAASQTHNQVRQDLVEADCKAMAETLRRDVIRPLVLFNFGDVSRLPWIKVHYEQPDDLEKSAKTYSILVSEIGLPVAADHIYEKFGVPKPKAGQTLLAPPARAVSPLAAKQTLVLASGRPGAEQIRVDELADRTLAEALPMIRALAAPVLRMIQEAESLEDLRARLAGVYGEMDTGELEDLIARATFAADLFGRRTVINDG